MERKRNIAYKFLPARIFKPLRDQLLAKLVVQLQGKRKEPKKKKKERKGEIYRGRGEENLEHLSQWLGNTGYDRFDLSRPETSESSLMLGTTESRSHGSLKISNRKTDRRSAFSGKRFIDHGEDTMDRI